jgi:signal peptidase I
VRWKLTVAVAVLVVAATTVLRTQVFDTVTVTSDSMAPTVCTGDALVLARLDNGNSVEASDVVTFASPVDGITTIKRVVAVGGQSIAVRDAQLMVDGQTVQEPYVDHASIDGVYFGPVTVPPGDLFVMGDHRETSIDSRLYGPIPTAVIDGTLLGKLWSKCDPP